MKFTYEQFVKALYISDTQLNPYIHLMTLLSLALKHFKYTHMCHLAELYP